MNYLASDQANVIHIASANADGWWTSDCGISTGTPEYETQASKQRLSHLLLTMESGCERCGRVNGFNPKPGKRGAYA